MKITDTVVECADKHQVQIASPLTFIPYSSWLRRLPNEATAMQYEGAQVYPFSIVARSSLALNLWDGRWSTKMADAIAARLLWNPSDFD